MSADAPRFTLKPRRLSPPPLRALLRSAVFLACLMVWCEKLLLPLEVPAMAVVAQLAAQQAGAHGQPRRPELAVLKIDPATFRGASRDEFRGMLPLDRCVLARHVRALQAARPDLQQLGIDLDLSPTRVSALDDCGSELLAQLGAATAAGLRVTLILPVDEIDRAESAGWREQVRAAGVELADPRVVREFGVVRSHWKRADRCPTLGQALGEPVPASAAAACATPRLDTPDAEMSEGDPYMVAYHALIGHAWVPGPGADGRLMRLGDQIEALRQLPSVRRVLLGAHFDASDEHLTPIGPLAGVEVHAAVALSPGERVHHVWGWLIDVAFGLLCGFGAHAVWARYFQQLLGHPGPPPTVSGQWLAYRWPLLMLVAWLVLALFVLPGFSLAMLRLAYTWINPVPMMVGMSVDAFVLGSLAAAVHHAGAGMQPVADPPRGPGARLALGVLARLPALAWWAVVLPAGAALLLHKTPVALLLAAIEP